MRVEGVDGRGGDGALRPCALPPMTKYASYEGIDRTYISSHICDIHFTRGSFEARQNPKNVLILRRAGCPDGHQDSLWGCCVDNLVRHEILPGLLIAISKRLFPW